MVLREEHAGLASVPTSVKLHLKPAQPRFSTRLLVGLRRSFTDVLLP